MVSIVHGRLAPGVDAGDGTISADDWDEPHILIMNSGKILGRTTATEGDVEEISAGYGVTLADGLLSSSDDHVTFWNSSHNMMPAIVSTAAMALAANTLYAVPIFFSKGGTVGRIAVNVTTGAGSTAVRLGLAKNRASGLGPGEIIINGSVTAATTGTGVASATVSGIVEHAGLYWMLLVTNGTPSITGASLMPHIIGADTSFAPTNRLDRSFTYGTFSDESAQTYTRTTGTNNCPLIMIGG